MGQLIGGGRRPRDGHVIGEPLVADRDSAGASAHAVGISQRVGGGERGVLGSRAANRHFASGVVVDVLNRRGGCTELGLGLVCQVRIGGLD